MRITTAAEITASVLLNQAFDIPAIADYRTVFEQLFPPADGKQLRDAQARLELDKSILDTALADVKDFRRNLGVIDQRRLDQATFDQS